MAAPSPFDRYIAPARARSSVWRVLGGGVIIVTCWFLATMALLLGRVGWVMLIDGAPIALALESGQQLLAAGSPLSLLAIMSSFLGVWIGVWAALKLFHKRPFGTLFSPERQIRWKEFGAGLLLSAVFFVLSVAAALILVGAPARSDLDAAVWALWIVPVILGIFIQATAEELLFRGYILQQLAVWSRNPIVWALLPSLLFGSLHLDPGKPLEINLQIGFITFLVGVITAALVWRTGSLAASMGLHLGVNCQALTLVGAEETPLGGGQLWLYEAGSATTLYTIDMVSVIALLALVLSPWLPFGLASAAPSPQLSETIDGG